MLLSTIFSTTKIFAITSNIKLECCAYAVIRSCDQINVRLATFRVAMQTATWEELDFAADR